MKERIKKYLNEIKVEKDMEIKDLIKICGIDKRLYFYILSSMDCMAKSYIFIPLSKYSGIILIQNCFEMQQLRKLDHESFLMKYYKRK